MKLTAALGHFFHNAAEAVRDILAAAREPRAMSAQQRHLDEFKVASGAAITGAGVAELNPLAVAGGMEPVWDGLADMQKAGHMWRARHPARQPA
jgi:hypothetical protein